MEIVIEKYFEQHLDKGAKPYYEKVLWYQSSSVNSGGVDQEIFLNPIKGDLTQFIWVTKLAVDFTGLGGPINFIDLALNGNLFTWQNSVPGFNIFDLNYIVFGNKLSLQCSDPLVIFSIGVVKVTTQKQ